MARSPSQKNERLDAALLSTAVHELKTPLLAMKLTLELLEGGKDPLSKTQRTYTEELAKSTVQLLDMVHDILAMTKLQDDHRARSRERVDIYELIQELSTHLQTLMTEKRLTFSWGSDPKRIDALVTNRETLRGALQNLLTNAVKYNRVGGTITVAVRNERRQCMIAVADTGMGIPKDEQQKIFDRFFRASNVKAVDPYGTGLGLFLTKALVEQIGGTISFISQQGKGTTFTIALPLVS